MTARGGRSIWLLLGHTSGASAAASSFHDLFWDPTLLSFPPSSLSLSRSLLSNLAAAAAENKNETPSLSLSPLLDPHTLFRLFVGPRKKKPKKDGPPTFLGRKKTLICGGSFFLSLDGGPLLCNVRVRRTHLRCTRTHTRQIRTTRKQDDAAAAAADATFKKRREECVVLRFGGGRPRQVHSRAPSSIIEKKNQKTSRWTT